MNIKKTVTKSPLHQHGAALVVALIMLVALSLLAISSMNTATLDLVMAGNEQYRSQAFANAETGIERALASGTFNTGAATSSSSSGYSYSIEPQEDGAIQDAPPGYSEGSGQFGTVYFRITATGTSERGSRSVNTQELYQVVKSGDSVTCDTTANCALD